MKYYKKSPCLKCGSIAYKIKELGLLDENSYYSERECRACHSTHRVSLPLTMPENGGYTYITDTEGTTRSLHYIVWGMVHKKKLSPGSRIHHINSKKRDNRPSNLFAMAHGHSAYLNYNSQNGKIKMLQKRIKELEGQLCQLNLKENR